MTVVCHKEWLSSGKYFYGHLYSTSVNRGLVKTARNNTSLVTNITLVINIGYLTYSNVRFFSQPPDAINYHKSYDQDFFISIVVSF